jgi:hypothetical protein
MLLTRESGKNVAIMYFLVTDLKQKKPAIAGRLTV